MSFPARPWTNKRCIEQHAPCFCKGALGWLGIEIESVSIWVSKSVSKSVSRSDSISVSISVSISSHRCLLLCIGCLAGFPWGRAGLRSVGCRDDYVCMYVCVCARARTKAKTKTEKRKKRGNQSRRRESRQLTSARRGKERAFSYYCYGVLMFIAFFFVRMYVYVYQYRMYISKHRPRQRDCVRTIFNFGAAFRGWDEGFVDVCLYMYVSVRVDLLSSVRSSKRAISDPMAQE